VSGKTIVGAVALAGAVAALGWLASWLEVAPVWALAVGLGVALAGQPPAIHRGLTALGGGAAGLVVLLVTSGLSETARPALAAGLLVLAAVIVRAATDVPAGAGLVGAGAMLAVIWQDPQASASDGAAVLTGLALGLLVVLAGELVAAASGRGGRRAHAEESTLPRGSDTTGAAPAPEQHDRQTPGVAAGAAQGSPRSAATALSRHDGPEEGS
jgi:hypothetical protein